MHKQYSIILLQTQAVLVEMLDFLLFDDKAVIILVSNVDGLQQNPLWVGPQY